MVTAEFIGSNLEIIVYDWLVRHNIEFSFQSSISGGFYELGGSVVDFILVDLNIALRIMGEYFHQGVAKTASDAMQREMLESEGFIVVDLWGEDLLDPDRREEAMSKAIRGEEILK